jgi:hypothetical protein
MSRLSPDAFDFTDTSVLPATDAGAEAKRVCDASTRVVRVVTEDLTVTAAAHAERLIVLDSAFSTTCTITLPAALGTGNRYTIIDAATQTNSVIVDLATATDYLTGTVQIFNAANSAGDEQFFTATATSDKMTMNATTSGGAVRGTKLEFVDIKTGYYLVSGVTFSSGNQATPFSAT